MKLKKAKILDLILLKFHPNREILWNEIHRGDFGDIAQHDLIVNNVNFLISDGLIARDVGSAFSLSLTDKGYAVMTDIKDLGYEKKSKADRRKNAWQMIVGFITLATFVILLLKTCIDAKINLHSSNSTTNKTNLPNVPILKIDTINPNNNPLHNSTDTTANQRKEGKKTQTSLRGN